MAQQRLQGAFLTVIGLAGAFGGVLFSIEAPRFTPVPAVFLTFWLVMVIVGQVLIAGLRKLCAAGVGAPAPGQVRAAAGVAAIVVAVGMNGLATTTGVGSAVAAPCPGGGPATCGPTPGPELTFTPPAQQTAAPGQQPGQQGPQQDNNGIATSPAGSGGSNGDNIQAQTPDFGSPGQPRPNIPGNEQPAQGQQGQQLNPVRTTAPGQPQQTRQQQTSSGQASASRPTVTVTQTQSQCPTPGAAGTPGAPGNPGAGNPGADGPDGGGEDDGAPSWAYLVGEASALLTGRRRPGSTAGGGGEVPGLSSGGGVTEAPTKWSAGSAARPVEFIDADLNSGELAADTTNDGGADERGKTETKFSDSITVERDNAFLDELRNIPLQYMKEDGGKGADGKEIIVTQLPNGQEMIQENGVTSIIGTPKPGQQARDPYPVQGANQVSTADNGNGTTTVNQTDSSGTPSSVTASDEEVNRALAERARQAAADKADRDSRRRRGPRPEPSELATQPRDESLDDKWNSVITPNPKTPTKSLPARVGNALKDTGKGLLTLVGLGGEGAPSVGEAWKQVGKGLIAYDEFAKGEYFVGIGLVLTNFLGLKGLGSLKNVARAREAAELARAGSKVGEEVRAGLSAAKTAEDSVKAAGNTAKAAAEAVQNAITGVPSRGVNGFPTPRSIRTPSRPRVTRDIIDSMGARITTWADGGRLNFNPLNGQAFTGIQASITKDMLGQGSKAAGNIAPPGWNPLMAWPGGNLQRGHALANILGGTGRDARNLFTVTKTANDAMQKIEAEVRRAVELGKVIEYTVKPVYGNGISAPPTKLVISAMGDGLSILRTITNIP
ncbi:MULTISPECIES: DNA/RNA non-specific endonuclease [Tsukamurella]|uniref:DNA/RNA non-specific endonuclease n=1 Tax=Tsukamurella strandjordii TaxID=147577 RepID=A0AA90SMZ8_9ACTN|nr:MULTISPECIES: DNA/RNA non-specific endonuclease [Tsukamurella]MDP0399818.1 DNA/RNA non-specific endonuclease [Tsukamurella strandjordii]GIZ97417.1 hypothetical protein TTY48_20290 [Tsukamurella sp. TY48]